MEYLSNFGYPRPNDFFDINPQRLQEIYDEVKNDKKVIDNKIGALKRKKNKTEADEYELFGYTANHKLLSKHKNTLYLYLNSLDLQMGEGLVQQGRSVMYFSPQELLKRFELLNGSLAAGNNGVLPEYIQIAHRLRDLGIITNNQLNKLLRKII